MCFKNARRNPCNFTGSGQLLIFLDRMVDSNSNTLRNVMKADITLGNSGALNCWTRQMKDALVICRLTLYTEVTYYNAGSWIFLICA